MTRGGRAILGRFIGITFRAGAVGGACRICSPPLSPLGAGSSAGARMFQRTFGFKVGGSGIFLTGASGMRGGGALTRRNAGLGAGVGALLRIGSGFSGRTTGAGRTCGLGSGTIAGLFRGVSSGAGSGCSFFGLREGTTVRVK